MSQSSQNSYMSSKAADVSPQANDQSCCTTVAAIEATVLVSQIQANPVVGVHHAKRPSIVRMAHARRSGASTRLNNYGVREPPKQRLLILTSRGPLHGKAGRSFCPRHLTGVVCRSTSRGATPPAASCSGGGGNQNPPSRTLHEL